MVKEVNIKEQDKGTEGNNPVDVKHEESEKVEEKKSSRSKRKPSKKLKEEGKELEEKEIALAETKDKFIRLYSEFENYRRRTSKEKIELISTANSELIYEMLPVIDDFERAFLSLENIEETSESVMEGFNLIYNKFISILNQKGLKLMEIEKGDEFDSDLHDAIAKIPVDDKKLSGKIVDVTEKGYFLGDRVIRHAKVVIGS
ncbi:nucleotide exchange factor GrpE [Bacteroidota bacterium]